MAVDTRNRRMSMIGLALPPVSVLPHPDGAIDTKFERQQYWWSYSGIGAHTIISLTHNRWIVPFMARTQTIRYDDRTHVIGYTGRTWSVTP